MTTTPFEPNPDPDQGVPAADAGAGAPPPEPGFGVAGADGTHEDDRPDADIGDDDAR